MKKENSAISLLGKYDNVFVLRSFSKGHALAGIRIGYLATREELQHYYGMIDDQLLNMIGLEAASIAFNDGEHLSSVIRQIAYVKERIIVRYSSYGYWKPITKF